jgi:hypothetical protein
VVLLNTSAHRVSTKGFRLGLFLYLFISIVSGLGLLGKLQLVRRIVPIPLSALYIIVTGWIFLPLTWSFALRARRILAPLVLLGIVVCSLFIYPHMQDLQKRTGRGTDQPDCVTVAAEGIATGNWPYSTLRMWDHMPMSCGPGWVLLQTPMVISVGYRWNLLALWALALVLLRSRLSYDVIAGMLTLLGLAAVTWVTVSDGTDFITFGVLLAALFVALQTPSKLALVYLSLLTLVVQFRFPMIIVPVLLSPRKRLLQGIVVSIAAFACYMLFLAWRPEAFISDGPLHLFYKLTRIHVFAYGRWSAILEVTVVFAGMLSTAVFVRRVVQTRWAALAYLLVLTLVPSILDLIAKYRLFATVLASLGIWEGANWLSSCLPLATIALLFVADDLYSVDLGRTSHHPRSSRYIEATREAMSALEKLLTA